MDAAAEILAGVHGTYLLGLQTGAAGAQFAADVGQWTRAAREVASTLRLGADRYRDEESAAVAALR